MRTALEEVGYATTSGTLLDQDTFLAIHDENETMWPALKVATGGGKVIIRYYGSNTVNLAQTISRLRKLEIFQNRIWFTPWQIRELIWEDWLTEEQQNELLAYPYKQE